MSDHQTTPIDVDYVRGQLRWHDLADRQARPVLTCIDGRYDGERIGAPGGDVGEFLVVVAALEEHAGEPCSPAWVDRGLRALMDEFGPFHMHTDEAAVDAMARELADGDRHGDTAGMQAQLRRPSATMRQRLAELVARPGFQGCGHLGQMMDQPGAYGISLASIQQAVSTFFEVLWSGAAQADLEVLAGDHAEEAVGVIRVVDADLAAQQVPAIQIDADAPAVFTEHPQARRVWRRQFLTFLSRRRLLEDDVDVDRLWEITQRVEDRHRDQTIEALCPELPVVDVEIQKAETFKA